MTPSPTEILERIDAYTLAVESLEPPRKHLGASVLGEKCIRKTWMNFRFVKPEKFPPKMLRLFKSGDAEEPRMIALLRGAGFKIEASCEYEEGDPELEMFKFKDCSGHLAGTIDGVGAGPPLTEDELLELKRIQQLPPEQNEYFLLEIKTCKDETVLQPSAGFTALCKNGVKSAFPKHYDQMVLYCGQLNLPRALYCVRGKNHDRLYFEWVEFNRGHFEELLTKAEVIINSTAPPEKLSQDPTYFECRYCHLNQICHANASINPSDRHCRNCKHSHPAENSQWHCSLGKEFGTLCPSYQPIVGGS